MNIKYKMSWFEKTDIDQGHDELPITQVYCWVISSDNKIALVSKDGQKWQFPGGHPLNNETLIQTLTRELGEELSYQLAASDKPKFFGYYVIEELDENNNLLKKYLQTRFYLKIVQTSNEIILKPNERNIERDTEKINYCKWISIKEACGLINWLEKSAELSSLLSFFNPKE